MRTVAQSQRERDCGHQVCTEDHPEIRVRNVDGARKASYSGLLRCGHVWTCAPCSQRIRARQAKRIAQAVEWLGGSWAMLTLTLRHDRTMPLKDTVRALKGAWRRMRQRRDVRDIWKAVAFAPVTTCEVTWSEENGWHPHLHVAFKVGRALALGERELLALRWQSAIEAELGSRARPSDERGMVWSREFDGSVEGDRALYVAKLGLELEVADPGLAKRSKGRTPFELARAAAEGDPRAYALWIEFCRGTKGLHVLQLSPEASTAARACKLSKETYDAPPAPEPVNIALPTETVRMMRTAEHRWPTVFHSLLCAAEEGGSAGAWRWMVRHFPRSLIHGPHVLHVELADTG